jgi:hypothetical protein
VGQSRSPPAGDSSRAGPLLPKSDRLRHHKNENGHARSPDLIRDAPARGRMILNSVNSPGCVLSRSSMRLLAIRTCVDRLALQAILDKYLRKEFAAWAKQFPDDFYREIFRLRNWTWRGIKVNRPQVVARYTNDLVYARLAPGVLKVRHRQDPACRYRFPPPWRQGRLGALLERRPATQAALRTAPSFRPGRILKL